MKISVTKIANFTGHGGSIYALYVSPISKHVYTGANDGYVVEWDLLKPAEGRLLCRLNQPVYSIYLNEERQQLWIGVASGNIHIVDLKTKEELKNLEVHKLGIFDIKEEGGLIYAAGGDGCVSVWNADTMELLQLKKFSEKSARVIALNPKGDFLAVGFSDHSIAILSKNFELVYQKLTAHQNSVFSLAYTPDGQYLLSGGRDAMLKIWEFGPDLKIAKEIAAHNLHVHCISVQKEGNYFLTSSMDKTIKIWSLQDFSLLKVIDKLRNESHTNSINKISWVNEYEFVSIGDDKVMIFWRLNYQI